MSQKLEVDQGKIEALEIRKYLIPHDGDIEIQEDGNIHVIREIGDEREITKIMASAGITDEYREDLNERQKFGEKAFNAMAGAGKKGPKPTPEEIKERQL